jgi:hypothetical protein
MMLGAADYMAAAGFDTAPCVTGWESHCVIGLLA